MNLSFSTYKEFEKELSLYTGAPYVVLTDSCTHAIELCLRLKNSGPCIIPSRTYLSVPMTFHKLGIDYSYDTHNEWKYEYQLTPSNIWDSARAFDKDMYRAGMLQCLSFGPGKRLEIGHGGAILSDSKEDYLTLKRMAYDGRDLDISPWQNQVNFVVGYHYMMRLEDALKGIQLMMDQELKNKETQLVEYPDCSKLNIDHLPK